MSRKFKKFSDEECELLKKLKVEGVSYKDMLEHFDGRTIKSLQFRSEKLGITNKANRYTYNIDFFKKDTPELAYFLGFFMAYGYLGYDKGDYAIIFGLSYIDKHILEYFANLVCPEKPIYYKEIISELGTLQKINCLNFSCKEICDCMIDRFGFITPKTGKEFVIFEDNKELFNCFLHGFFDGDGHICVDKYNRPGIGMASSSDSFLKHISDILGYGAIYKQADSNCYSLAIDKLEHVIDFRSRIYENGFEGLRRKYCLFQNCNWSPSNTYWTKSEIEELVVARKDNVPYKEIAKIIGRAEKSIRGKAEELKIINGPKRMSQSDLDYIKNNQHLTGARLSKELGFSKSSICYHKRNLLNNI